MVKLRVRIMVRVSIMAMRRIMVKEKDNQNQKQNQKPPSLPTQQQIPPMLIRRSARLLIWELSIF